MRIRLDLIEALEASGNAAIGARVQLDGAPASVVWVPVCYELVIYGIIAWTCYQEN
jgi:hypothetical protein